MAKILAISSQVVFGPVGLNAIVPALQAEGHDVLALPTVLLSNHPGLGKPAGAANDLAPIIQALENINAFENLDAIITGYFSNAEQVKAAAALIRKLSPKIVLIDPVLGDHGKLYVPLAVAEAIRDHLIPLATITTPNSFELSWLTGIEVASEAEAQKAAQSLNVAETIVTSVPAEVYLATLHLTSSSTLVIKNKKRQSVPNGTGDFLSGLYLARLWGEERNSALPEAMAVLQHAITLSGETKILAIAQALH